MNKSYKALEIIESDGIYRSNIKLKETPELNDGFVQISVKYSSLNYKDALSANGNKGVTKSYPHVPGIDAAGIITASKSSKWDVGTEVLVTGFDLGMNTDGGFAEFITVPENWVVALPSGLTLKESMIYGTAGFTAGLSVAAIIERGIKPEDGWIAVSGSTGGVGSIAVSILHRLGYKIAAITSKESANEYIKSLGAQEIIPRSEVDDHSNRILLKPRFAAAIDTVGGNVLATLIKSLEYGGIATTCGMVNGGAIPLTVFPFILKGIYLAGIDSVEIPMEKRLPIWKHLASDWKPENLSDLVEEIGLDDVPEKIEKILNGQMKGRALVKL